MCAIKLNLSRLQIGHLIIKYKENGKSSFVHGNRGQVPTKAIDESIFNEIILLYKNKYYNFNFYHFKDFLEDDENIKVSYNFIYKHLTKVGILSPNARRKAKKEFKWMVLCIYGLVIRKHVFI